MQGHSSGRWVSIPQSPTRSPGRATTLRVCDDKNISSTFSNCSNPLIDICLGVYKRGVSLGFIIGWGNLNGIVSSNIYREADAPRFYPGHGTVLAYLVVFLFGGSIVQYVLLRRENAKRRRGERDHWIEGLDQNEIELLGDKRPDFMYTL